ncbi:MAG TPA: thiol reductant ABC exporter subunit CydD [Orrella sp.]
MDTTNPSSTSVEPRPASDTAPASFLLHLRNQGKATLRQLQITAVVSTIGIIAFSAAVALIVSAAMNSQTPAAELWLVGLLGLALRLGANLWRDHLAHALSARLRADLRARLLAQANALGPHQLARQGNTAWWAHQMLEQVDALHGYIARYLPARQAAMVVPLAIIITTLAVDWLAGLLILLATPIIPIFMVLIGWGTEAVHRSQQEQQASLSAHLMDRLQALPWLRRMGAVEQAQASVKDAAQTYRQVSMRVLRVAFLSSATLEFFSAVSIGLMAIYIGFALLGLISYGPADQMTLAMGLFMLMLAPECFLPLRQLAQAHHDMNAAKASADVLQSLLPEPGMATLQPGTKIEPKIEPCADPEIAMHLQAIELQWPDTESAVLNNVELTVPRGQIIGISGDSGQGKSTLLGVMAGFIKPDSGRVRRDTHWAWLAQRPHLFHATLRENLLIGCSAPVDDDTLITALADVGLALPHELLPQGLDTAIGELNQGVSGGQAQRIALCRSILSGATLWLLDEPTAALDADTRNALLDTIMVRARAQRVTMVMASHDQEALSRCDQVFTVGHGRLERRR